jgi:hypothetical protein
MKIAIHHTELDPSAMPAPIWFIPLSLYLPRKHDTIVGHDVYLPAERDQPAADAAWPRVCTPAMICDSVRLA